MTGPCHNQHAEGLDVSAPSEPSAARDDGGLALIVAVQSKAARRTPNLRRLTFLEHRRLEPVPLEELVELGAIALREQRRLGDVAARALQQSHEEIALQLFARFLEGNERACVFLQRALDE